MAVILRSPALRDDEESRKLLISQKRRSFAPLRMTCWEGYSNLLADGFRKRIEPTQYSVSVKVRTVDLNVREEAPSSGRPIEA
jgi:hypothetical protein